MTILPLAKLRNNTGQIDGVPANPRTINKNDYAKLIKSIQEDPEYLEHEMPHVIKHNDYYVVLNGNQRLRALKELGFKETPVTIYKEDTPAEVIKSRIIKSNHGYGKDDQDMLANQWSDLPLDDWGLKLPGFGQEEVVEDEAPEVSSEPAVSKLGEIYRLGRHRVMCGDSTCDLKYLMAEDKANLLLTDPPYGVSYADKNAFLNTISPGNRNQTKIANDHQTPDEMKEFWTEGFGAIFPYLFNDASYYICSPQRGELPLLLLLSLYDIGYPSRHTIIWNKNNHVLGRSDYNYKHEPLLFGWKEKHIFYGNGNHHDSVWDINKPQSSKEHPTMKPIELMAECVLNSSKKDDIVLDPYLGSGSTLIACEQTDRICYGMEIDPKYVDVIRKRYWKFVNNNDETGWEENTPLISGGSADNGS